MHEIGQYTVNNGSIVYDSSSIIENPAILLDANKTSCEDAYVTVLKLGNANAVESYFQMFTEKARTSGVAHLYQDLKCIIFDKYAYLNADDIATIFNIAMNCTGHSILRHLADGNSEKLRHDIDKMQTLGY